VEFEIDNKGGVHLKPKPLQKPGAEEDKAPPVSKTAVSPQASSSTRPVAPHKPLAPASSKNIGLVSTGCKPTTPASPWSLPTPPHSLTLPSTHPLPSRLPPRIKYKGELWYRDWIISLRADEILSSFFVDNLLQLCVRTEVASTHVGPTFTFSVSEMSDWNIRQDRLWADLLLKVNLAGAVHAAMPN
jgi:hypothetical protein